MATHQFESTLKGGTIFTRLEELERKQLLDISSLSSEDFELLETLRIMLLNHSEEVKGFLILYTPLLFTIVKRFISNNIELAAKTHSVDTFDLFAKYDGIAAKVMDAERMQAMIDIVLNMYDHVKHPKNFDIKYVNGLKILTGFIKIDIMHLRRIYKRTLNGKYNDQELISLVSGIQTTALNLTRIIPEGPVRDQLELFNPEEDTVQRINYQKQLLHYLDIIFSMNGVKAEVSVKNSEA